MALHEPGGRAGNYDDFLKKLPEEHTKSIDDAVAALEEFEKKENRQHYYDLHKTGLDKMYHTFKVKLTEVFGQGMEASVHGEENEKKVKKALHATLLEYLAHTRPETVEAIKELETEESQLEQMIALVDEMHSADPRRAPNPQRGQGMSVYALLGPTKNKNGTVGDLLETMAAMGQNYMTAWNAYLGRFITHHVSKFDKWHLMSHARGKVEERYKIDDKAKFYSLKPDQYADLLKAHKTDDWEHISLEKYGLKQKEEEH